MAMCPIYPAARLMSGVLILLACLASPARSLAQTTPPPPPSGPLTLAQCLQYAISNQPLLRQARLDEEAADADIRIARAAWLPQVGLTASVQHYFGLPYTVIPIDGINTPRQVGLRNTSTLGLSGTQVLYNNEVNLASRGARFTRQGAQQNTVGTRIDVVADVSKAFYDILLSERQLAVFQEDIIRLQRNLRDARARYDVGLVDKTDYLQAEISLNNSLAGRKQAQESINAKKAYLRQLMNLPQAQPLALQHDTLRLEQEAVFDTTAALDPANRIEIQQLQTRKALQNLNVDYYRLGFLPSFSAFGNYNSVFQNNRFGDLYGQRFPNSYAGLQATLPIFTGFRRTQNLRRARLLNQRLDEDILNTRNQINTEYARALASYKGYYNDYLMGQRNLELSRQVYQVVNLQYREGIKTYLDLLVAQTTLRTSQLNYYSALFQVLASKVDVQRALGALPTEY
ncbi:TolC family protein [Hymenobacter sp. J193]|uniref:TolC family protein n=1 Tax=Hymenobacter sp. J193 TaxID=2898429 RepID=UPI002151943B|nr:TolC family protein [Hymenobacter sp. J193]MCR5886634.1 TolC family protein [Hymenobacter sp. J193]